MEWEAVNFEDLEDELEVDIDIETAEGKEFEIDIDDIESDFSIELSSLEEDVANGNSDNDFSKFFNIDKEQDLIKELDLEEEKKQEEEEIKSSEQQIVATLSQYAYLLSEELKSISYNPISGKRLNQIKANDFVSTLTKYIDNISEFKKFQRGEDFKVSATTNKAIADKLKFISKRYKGLDRNKDEDIQVFSSITQDVTELKRVTSSQEYRTIVKQINEINKIIDVENENLVHSDILKASSMTFPLFEKGDEVYKKEEVKLDEYQYPLNIKTDDQNNLVFECSCGKTVNAKNAVCIQKVGNRRKLGYFVRIIECPHCKKKLILNQYLLIYSFVSLMCSMKETTEISVKNSETYYYLGRQNLIEMSTMKSKQTYAKEAIRTLTTDIDIFRERKLTNEKHNRDYLSYLTKEKRENTKTLDEETLLKIYLLKSNGIRISKKEIILDILSDMCLDKQLKIIKENRNYINTVKVNEFKRKLKEIIDEDKYLKESMSIIGIDDDFYKELDCSGTKTEWAINAIEGIIESTESRLLDESKIDINYLYYSGLYETIMEYVNKYYLEIVENYYDIYINNLTKGDVINTVKPIVVKKYNLDNIKSIIKNQGMLLAKYFLENIIGIDGYEISCIVDEIKKEQEADGEFELSVKDEYLTGNKTIDISLSLYRMMTSVEDIFKIFLEVSVNENTWEANPVRTSILYTMLKINDNYDFLIEILDKKRKEFLC